jgi:hypothetical protein
MTANAPQFTGITPYLHYDDVATMIDWLTGVFGFTERGRWLDAQGGLRNANALHPEGSGEARWYILASSREVKSRLS